MKHPLVNGWKKVIKFQHSSNILFFFFQYMCYGSCIKYPFPFTTNPHNGPMGTNIVYKSIATTIGYAATTLSNQRDDVSIVDDVKHFYFKIKFFNLYCFLRSLIISFRISFQTGQPIWILFELLLRVQTSRSDYFDYNLWSTLINWANSEFL